MKNSIANVWLIGIVTLFIFVFAGYLAITVNYTKTFKVKNEILTIIEKQKGMVNHPYPDTKTSIVKSGNQVHTGVGSLQIVSLYLYGSGYKIMGTCDMVTESALINGKWYGVSDLGIPASASSNINPSIEEAVAGRKYYYCFSKATSRNTSTYYRVQLFYKMELPVLGDLFTFRVEGTTDEITNPTCTTSTYCTK